MNSLRATATLALRAEKPISFVELELNPQLQISRISDGAGGSLTFERNGRYGSRFLTVTLPAETSGEFALRISYSGAMAADELDYISSEGILLRDESGWYPTPDMSTFAPHRIHMVVPNGWTAVAGGNSNVLHFRNREIFDFVTFRPVYSRTIAATPMGIQAVFPSSADGSAPAIRVAARDSDKEAVSKAGNVASNAFAEYARLFGSAGLSEFTIIPGFPGSHSEAGYSGPGFLVMDEEDLKFFGRKGYTPNFLPHEIAHQWFPQQVAHASAEDGWMAEALAEYMGWRFLDARDPASARRIIAIAMRDSLAAEHLEPISLGLKLFALGNDVTQQTLYERGMLVWRTLETVIDRERVEKALREYLKRYRGGAASIADFQKICEEISGRDLGWFFKYYIGGTEVPEITLRRTQSFAPNEVSGEILVAGAPPGFEARVEMQISTSAGIVSHSVAAHGPVTPFTVLVAAPASRIELDPELRILRWTEAAKRNRAQRTIISQANSASRAGDLERAGDLYHKALTADLENIAGNDQFLYFLVGQNSFRRKQFDSAFEQMSRVLETASLDARATDAWDVWAHVYRARIDWVRGDANAARAEAQTALDQGSPALGTEVVMGDLFRGKTTAERELRMLLEPPVDTKSHR
ncbi:MAG TPA: M1 family aminopeptidase [Candidatus Acidoferrum sp.]|nr:M1 family aminopeptidase [Candidatus Acidoferrum sp.]